MSKTKKPKRLMLFLPYIILAGLLIAYSGFWIFSAANLKNKIINIIQKNDRLQVADISIGGFPSQFRIILKNISYEHSRGIIKSERLNATSLVYKPRHIIFWAEGAQSFTANSGKRLTLHGEAISASLVIEENNAKRMATEFLVQVSVGANSAPLILGGNGYAYADPQNNLDGTVSLEIGNLRKLATYLEQIDLISRRDSRNLLLMAGFASARAKKSTPKSVPKSAPKSAPKSEEAEALSLTLQLKDGVISLVSKSMGSIPLGSISIGSFSLN